MSDNEMLHDQQHQDSFKIRLGQQVADKMNQNIFGQVILMEIIVEYLRRDFCRFMITSRERLS